MDKEHQRFSPSISLIIPWRDINQRDRNDIAEWCFEYYKFLFPNAEIIFCDSEDDIFSRGKSINKGVSESSGEYLIITDADYLFDKSMAQQIVNKQPWTVGVKKKNYYFLNQGITQNILSENPADFNYKNSDLLKNASFCPYPVYGGLLAMPRVNFIKFDEQLSGYGYEDNIWYLCMSAFYEKEFRTDNAMFHMCHVRTAGSEYMQKSYENKAYWDKVWKPLEGDRKAIRELVKIKNMLLLKG